jgi:hypothetical protein
MIHNVLTTIAGELNEFLQNELGLSDDLVQLTSIVDVKGNVSLQIENRVCLFVQNIEEEKLIKNSGFPSGGGTPPPVYINLYLVFAANFPEPNYLESLRFISLIIEFFQGKYIFDRSNTPTLPPGIDKIGFELINLDLQELNNLWSLIGSKYIPSLLYKMKMLTFNQGMIKQDVSNIIQGSEKTRKKISGLGKLILGAQINELLNDKEDKIESSE